jgi:hypothetical protein
MKISMYDHFAYQVLKIFIDKKRRDLDITTPTPSKDVQIGQMIWTACYTAVDFRARLRFPRTAVEPSRRLRSCGFSPVPLFPQEPSPCLPINR